LLTEVGYERPLFASTSTLTAERFVLHSRALCACLRLNLQSIRIFRRLAVTDTGTAGVTGQIAGCTRLGGTAQSWSSGSYADDYACATN
jgi:hypothetical protein